MKPRFESEKLRTRGSGQLADKAALITGGDSKIGRAVAIALAKEDANVAILYLEEQDDAEQTRHRVEEEDGECLTMAGDVEAEAFCRQSARTIVDKLHRLAILVNNAAEQQTRESLVDMTAEQLERTFRTNVLSCCCAAKAALPHLKAGGTIIGTTSVTAYCGSRKCSTTRPRMSHRGVD